MAHVCQSLNEDDTPCTRPVTCIVRGRPGYSWFGYHCTFHGREAAKHYDHQGGCIFEWVSR